MGEEDRTLPEALRNHLDLEGDGERVRELWEKASAGEREDALDRLLFDCLLTDSLSERTREGARVDRDESATGTSTRGRAVSWRMWAAAAVLAVVVGLAGYLSWGQLGYPGPEATGDYRLASFTGEPVTRRSLLRGDRLTAGPGGARVTVGGYCDLSLDSGAAVVVEGAPGEEVIRLEEGKLVSHVTPDRGAFTVLTPLGSLKVLGTEFEVLVTLPEQKGAVVMGGSRKCAIVTVMVVSGLVGFELGDETGVLSSGMTQAFGAEAGGGKIAHGKPSYRAKGGNVHWKEKGRIVGVVQNGPNFAVRVLDASGKVAATQEAEALKDGKRAYEVWLKPGTYTLEVAAKGYDKLTIDGLVVKTDNDLRVDLEF